MSSLRDIVIFIAGAEFFHTISHIILPFFITLPINIGFMQLTPAFNYWAIAINAIITVILLWWAYLLKKKET